jgi:hypothetical protein
MKSTIRTEAGCAVITSLVGRVSFNGGSMLPHEAYLIGSELQRAAAAANEEAARAANGDTINAAAAIAS